MNLLSQSFVKYGLIQTALIILCLALMEWTGQNDSFNNESPLQLFLMFVAPFIVWFLGIKEKKRELKNKMTFRQGLTEGFKISLVYAITSPFVFLLYYLLVNPGILEYVRTTYQMSGANDTTVIIVDLLVQFFSAIVFGTIYGAIISFFLKSK